MKRNGFRICVKYIKIKEIKSCFNLTGLKLKENGDVTVCLEELVP